MGENHPIPCWRSPKTTAAAPGGGTGGALSTEMTGAGYDHSLNPVVVNLQPEGTGRRATNLKRWSVPSAARPGT